MGQLLRRIRNHLSALSSIEAEESPDPKAQLEHAIADAQEQHRQLRDQAANVVGNQRQTELRLAEAMQELEKLTVSARQAVLMADVATREGDDAKAAELTRAAEGFANRMVATEEEVSTLKALHAETSQAAERAKRAVEQNAIALQAKLVERQRLLNQLDQATMQEQMNRAMDQLSQSVDGGGSTMEQVRDEIETRYARALAEAEVRGRFEAQSLELEQARMDSEAEVRLDRIRSQLGLASGAEAIEPPAAREGKRREE